MEMSETWRWDLFSSHPEHLAVDEVEVTVEVEGVSKENMRELIDEIYDEVSEVLNF